MVVAEVAGLWVLEEEGANCVSGLLVTNSWLSFARESTGSQSAVRIPSCFWPSLLVLETDRSGEGVP